MTCHALNCPNPALPGMPQCLAHWRMLPATVRDARPWVGRWVDRLHISHEKPVDDSGNLHKEAPNVHERGQLELFA
jgi:hypothetical protein